MKLSEMYFCLYLTENEHGIVEGYLRKECEKNNCNLLYYRELKEGHVPMYREIKIVGASSNMAKIKEYIAKERLVQHMQGNPHKVTTRYTPT